MPYNKSPFKMKPKSPLMKALVGNQKNLNEGLKAAILASPAKQKGDVKVKDVPDMIVDGVKNLGKKIGNIKISTEEGRKRRKERKELRDKQREEKKNSPNKKRGCKSPVKQKMEMVEVNGKKVPKFAADGKGAGDLKKSSPAKGYKSAAQRKAVHASKADGGKGHPDKKKSPAKKYKSPAKAHCKSPAKQAKSKKEMKYDKTAQKAENAAVEGKVRKNSRLVNKANKMNKKNNLGKGKIAKM
tara:strand:- start:1283 stop:2008 length:726 start_codon:yes stop_codon:yes gene_type:complete